MEKGAKMLIRTHEGRLIVNFDKEHVTKEEEQLLLSTVQKFVYTETRNINVTIYDSHPEIRRKRRDDSTRNGV